MWNSEVQMSVIKSEDQLLCLQFDLESLNKKVYIVILYPKVSTAQRRLIWDNIEDVVLHTLLIL